MTKLILQAHLKHLGTMKYVNMNSLFIGIMTQVKLQLLTKSHWSESQSEKNIWLN